jgi:F0F1-type ATP synthase assembly protein I
VKAKKSSKGPNQFLKYSQLGFQLFVTIGLFTWLGYLMDDKWRQGKPLFLLIMMFLGMIGGFFQFYKSLPKDEN